MTGSWRGALVLRCAAMVSVALAVAVLPASARTIDYLYVEANEGGSSGGHVALRFDDTTYHFQHEDAGRIRLRRDNSAVFLHAYATLGNRPIHESRIAVSDDTYDLIERAFATSYLRQARHFEYAARLRDVEAVLAAIWHRRARMPAATLQVPAVGLFLPDGGDVTTEGMDAREAKPDAALAALRARIRRERGSAFLGERMAELRRALAAAPLDHAAPVDALLTAEAEPGAGPTAAEQYLAQVVALQGLTILEAALPLQPDAVYRPAGPDLSADEQRRLGRQAEQLESAVLGLLASTRPDWGVPFVVGMARLAAMRESQRAGRLVLLRADTAGGRSAPMAVAPELLAALEADTLRDLATVRARVLGDDTFREGAAALLELAGERWRGAHEAVGCGYLRPLATEPTVPSRAARRTDVVVPHTDSAALGRVRQAVAAATRRYDDQLDRLYGYDLVSRNCVSAIFAVIDDALATVPAVQARTVGPAAIPLAHAVRDESRRRLGGYVDTGWGLTFVPFVSARAVDAEYAVTERHYWPSYRQRQVRAMLRHESAAAVYLRESNTVTSTVYQGSGADSPFVFFTDDAVLLRPLLGAANLAVGLASSVVGVLTAPADGAQRLLAGLRSVMFSMPELVFANIRKGSMVYVPREAATTP